MYLAPQNIPRAISVLTLGNKVVLRERDREREREVVVVVTDCTAVTVQIPVFVLGIFALC